jgi:hypothetical protein
MSFKQAYLNLIKGDEYFSIEASCLQCKLEIYQNNHSLEICGCGCKDNSLNRRYIQNELVEEIDLMLFCRM